MKRICFCLIFAMIFGAVAAEVKAQTSLAGFDGNWMLDKEKTNVSRKDFPQKLKNYKMAVSEIENSLNVKSQVDGQVNVEPLRDRSSGSGDNVSGGGGRTTSASTGVSGATSQTTEVQKPNYGGTMALFFTVGEMNYDLSGKEVKAETRQGLARIKVKPDKNGKGIQFTIIRRMSTSKGEIEVTVRETWKLSEDGKSMKLQRTVDTPSARDEIMMILSKVA